MDAEKLRQGYIPSKKLRGMGTGFLYPCRGVFFGKNFFDGPKFSQIPGKVWKTKRTGKPADPSE